MLQTCSLIGALRRPSSVITHITPPPLTRHRLSSLDSPDNSHKHDNSSKHRNRGEGEERRESRRGGGEEREGIGEKRARGRREKKQGGVEGEDREKHRGNKLKKALSP